MTQCDRTWEVQAARDGQLDPEALGSFVQHRATCSSCQAEGRALDELATKLRTVGAHTDEMALRRMRQRTLERAGSLLNGGATGRSYALLLMGALVAVAVVAVFVWQRPRAPAVAAVQVDADDSARWHRASERGYERVDLAHGTLLFRVARRPSDPRLIVRVPDGEIEDLGTVFSVSVEDGQTREIIVREGRVLFRRHGAPALQLVAGTSWRATEKQQEAAAPPSEPERDPAATPSVQPPVPKVHKPRRAPSAPQVAPTAPTSNASHGEDDAGSAEDAAYLHILALLREGRPDEARLAAFSYLSAFPNGFRAIEVARIAGAPVPEGEKGKN